MGIDQNIGKWRNPELLADSSVLKGQCGTKEIQ